MDATYKLCYVDGHRAYFTTAPLAEQWGDDWNDAPYEHNAGTPYANPPFDVKSCYYDGWLMEPNHEHLNSPYSVEDINALKIPWLRSDYAMSEDLEIWAGTPFPEFVELVKRAKGEVYVPIGAPKETA